MRFEGGTDASGVQRYRAEEGALSKQGLLAMKDVGRVHLAVDENEENPVKYRPAKG